MNSWVLKWVLNYTVQASALRDVTNGSRGVQVSDSQHFENGVACFTDFPNMLKGPTKHPWVIGDVLSVTMTDVPVHTWDHPQWLIRVRSDGVLTQWTWNTKFRAQDLAKQINVNKSSLIQSNSEMNQ